MTKEEIESKYAPFIVSISDILGLGKTVDILKLCMTTDLFFKLLEERIAELEKENAKLKELLRNFLNAKSIEETCIAESEADKFLREVQ